MIKNLFRILVIENVVNVINHVTNYKSCKYRAKLISKLGEEGSEDIGESEMIYNETVNDYKIVGNSCTIYIKLFVIAFFIIIIISSSFIYFQ